MLNLNKQKQQKNEIFRIIEGKGFDPKLFSWTTHTNKIFEGHGGITGGYDQHSVTALVFRKEPKKFRFTFEHEEHLNPHNFYRKYHSSIEPQLTPGDKNVFAENWEGFMQRFQDWLDVIKYELEEPDLWESLPRGQALMATPPDYSRDEQFSLEERRLIAKRLSQIEKFIIDSNRLSSASAVQIKQTFIYLQQRTETASKLDWKNIFAGAIVGLILGKAVDNAPEIVKLCNELLSPFFQNLFQLTHAS